MAPKYNGHRNDCCEVYNLPASGSKECQIDHSASEQYDEDIPFELVSLTLINWGAGRAGRGGVGKALNLQVLERLQNLWHLLEEV